MSNITDLLSIDTVRVVIPTDHSDLETMFPASSRFEKFSPDLTPVFETSMFYFWSAEEFQNLRSDWSPPAFKIHNGKNILLQFSLPKILYGHSARLAFSDHLLPVLYSILQLLAAEWNISVSQPPENWQLNRIDVSYNFDFPDFQVLQDAYDHIKRLRFRGNLGHQSKRDNLAYWPGRSRTIKFYSKYLEMKKNKDEYGNQFIISNEDNLSKILRYEEEWHQKFLIRLTNSQKAHEVTVSRFLSYAHYHRPGWFVLKEMRKMFVHRNVGMKVSEARSKIKTLKKYNQYLDFLDQIIDNGYESVRKSFPDRNKFYRYNKKLRSLGIVPELFETALDSHFNRHEFNLEQYLSDNFTTSMDDVSIISDPLNNKIRKICYQNKSLQYSKKVV